MESRAVRQRGLTLVEMLVVIAISGMLGAFSIVSCTEYFHHRVEAEARKLASDLIWARQEAMARREAFYVDFDTGNATYVISNAGAEWKRRHVAANIVAVTDLSGVPYVPSSITFAATNGTCSGTLVNLTWGAQSRSVLIYGGSGYIKVQ